MAAGREWVAEWVIARDLGLSRQQLAQIRTERFTVGEHCAKKDGAGWVLFPAGLAVLADVLAGDEEDSHEPEKDAVPPAPPAPEAPVSRDLVIESLPRNRRVVVARVDGERVVVRIGRTSKLFRPGMVLPGCTPDRECKGTWNYHGPMPRKRGKW